MLLQYIPWTSPWKFDVNSCRQGVHSFFYDVIDSFLNEIQFHFRKSGIPIWKEDKETRVRKIKRKFQHWTIAFDGIGQPNIKKGIHKWRHTDFKTVSTSYDNFLCNFTDILRTAFACSGPNLIKLLGAYLGA